MAASSHYVAPAAQPIPWTDVPRLSKEEATPQRCRSYLLEKTPFVVSNAGITPETWNFANLGHIGTFL